MLENKRTDRNFVEPFVTPIKIYLFKDRNRVKMTVMVRPTFGITYLWEQDEFERLMSTWRNEFEGKALGANVFVGLKTSKTEATKGQQFIRMSVMSQYGTEHRFTLNTWLDLEREWDRQKHNEMPWDKKSDDA